MYLTVIATRYFLVNGAGEVLRLFILVAMGAAAYCAASFVLNRNGTLEMLEMARSIAVPKRT